MRRMREPRELSLLRKRMLRVPVDVQRAVGCRIDRVALQAMPSGLWRSKTLEQSIVDAGDTECGSQRIALGSRSGEIDQ